jgi:hypothetical protein
MAPEAETAPDAETGAAPESGLAEAMLGGGANALVGTGASTAGVLAGRGVDDATFAPDGTSSGDRAVNLADA